MNSASTDHYAASQSGEAPRKKLRNRETRSRETEKASVPRRALDKPLHADQQHNVRPSARQTRTADAKLADREFIDENGFRHIIVLRRRSEPIEDTQALPYRLPLSVRR